MERRAVWKTVLPHKRSIRVNPLNPRSKKKLSGETNTNYKDISDILNGGVLSSSKKISVIQHIGKSAAMMLVQSLLFLVSALARA